MSGDRKQVYIYIYYYYLERGLIENNDVAGGHFGQTVLTTYLSDDCPVYGAFKFGLYVLPRFVFRNLLSGLAYSVHTDDA